MALIQFKKDILPHIVAIVVFLIATIIFYSPAYFEGKEINQHDILQGMGGSQELAKYRETTGEEGLWTNSMFGGMPAYLISMKWSGDLLEIVQKIITLQLPSSSGLTFLCMLSFYIMLLAFRVRPYLAIVGALGFGFTSYNIIGIMAGHGWRVLAIAYFPLIIAGVHLVYSGKKIIGFGLSALAIGLEIKANHFQMTYYLLIMLLAYTLIIFIFSIKEKTLKPFLINTLILVLAGLIAIGANFGKLWAVSEYSKYSMRGPSEISIGQEENKSGLEREYVFRYSNSIFEPLVLIIPNFMGGASQQALPVDSNLGETIRRQTGMEGYQLQQQLQYVPTYWGKQPLTAPYYAGIALFFLFVIGLFMGNKRIKYWVLSIIAIGIILSWGNNFEALNYFLFDHLPAYNKFRSVTFTIIMSIIGIQLLAILGLENWLNNASAALKKRTLLYSLFIVGGFLFLTALLAGIGSYRAPIDEQIAGQVPQWYMDALREDRASLLRTDALRGLFFVALIAALLWFRLAKKISGLVFFAGLITIVYLDMALVGNRYLNKDSYAPNPVREFFKKTEADEAMLSQPGQFRVLNLNNPFNEARTSYFHSSIGGYHGAKIRRYQDLIDQCISGEINQLIKTLQSGKRDFSTLNVLNMLNTRFFYAGETKNMVFENNQAFGYAWLVKNIHQTNNPTEELQAVCKTNTRETAVINSSQVSLSATQFNDSGTIELTSYKPNHLVYHADLAGPSLVVFSEIYYPEGWEATVDGAAAEHFRADYILRAMELPQGEHTIEFRFKPKPYFKGNKVMLVFSGLTLLVFFFSIVYEVRKILIR